MAGGYAHQPQGPQAFAQQIRDLKAAVADLQKQIAGLGIQVDPASNSIVLGGSRAVKVLDTDGHTVAIIGALPSQFNRLDGSAQPGIALYREDGSLAAVLGDVNPLSPPFKQSFQILDRANNIVVADDTNGGAGLANPYVSGAVFADTNTTRWPQTTSASFVDIASGYFTVQNPRVQFDIQFVADASTTGQIRLLINGTQIDTTQSVTSTFGLWTRFRVALPASATIFSIASVELQAKRLTGTGIVYASVMRWEGDQSP